MKTNPLFVGEYNSGTGNDAAISLGQHKRYLKTFKKFFPYGVIFWQWSYKIDNGHHSFNLTKTVDGKIVPNDNFENLANAMEEVMA